MIARFPMKCMDQMATAPIVHAAPSKRYLGQAQVSHRRAKAEQ